MPTFTKKSRFKLVLLTFLSLWFYLGSIRNDLLVLLKDILEMSQTLLKKKQNKEIHVCACICTHGCWAKQ